jgi:colanic acid/amylovoran biosynthesis glycosyltransferase
MRIGLVLAATPPYSETFFRNKIRILSEHGYEVVLLSDKQNGKFDLCEERVGFSGGRVSILMVLTTILRLVINFPQAVKLFNANRMDGFSLNKNWLSLFTSAHILGLKLDWLHFGFATMAIGRENVAKIIGAKMAISVRGSDLHVYTIEHPNCYRLTWKKLDKLHTISMYLLHLAKEQGFNETHSSFKLISPAIDTDLFTPPQQRLSNSIPIILTVARLHWIKGLEYVIEAMAVLRERGIKFEYHIIGDGDDYKRLYFAVHQLNLTDCVFFHGKQSQSFVNEYLAKADLFIMYSLDEGFCNSVLEAQAMGCLTIVSNHPALMENVLDGETGFVVASRNSNALADSVENVLNLPSKEAERICGNAMKRVKETYNLKIQQQAFIHFYEEN